VILNDRCYHRAVTVAFRPPASATARPRTTLSIRARLLLLALIAAVPLMIDRARMIESDRAERINALSAEALALTRQGVEAQQEILIAIKSVVQVVARAHATLGVTEQNCTRFLAGATSDASWITGLSVIGANGRVACSTAPASTGLDLSDRPYIQEALRGKPFVVGEQAVGRNRGGVGLVAAVPTLNDSGTVTGVIAAGFELPWIERLAAETVRRPGAMLLVSDDAGTVLAAYPGREKWLRKRFDTNPLLAEVKARQDGKMAAEGIDGMRRVFGYARLPNTNAFLAIGLDEAEMLRRVDRETRFAYLKFALIGTFVLFGVWFGGEHSIVRPLRSLARMAMHIGHGNLQIRTTRQRWAAEFAPLAGALDAMAQRLTAREDELRVANEHLERLARHDGLSGLANRRSFDLKLEEEWRNSGTSGQPLALVMIDIDHFKLFNDHYGHLAGDACLRAVGNSLAQTTGAAVVARYGGEEFALLFAATEMSRAIDIAEGLRGAIERLALPHAAAPLGYVTASVGVASLRAAGTMSEQMLIEAADAALYGAKRRGRNAVVGHAAVELLAKPA
jgi:diguanylate cyclase (GGDEF)-like protein